MALRFNDNQIPFFSKLRENIEGIGKQLRFKKEMDRRKREEEERRRRKEERERNLLEELNKRAEKARERIRVNVEGVGKQLRFKARDVRRKIAPTLKKPIPKKIKPLARGIERVVAAPRKAVDYVKKFGGEAEKASRVTDEGIKSRYKGAYAMLNKTAADMYQGDTIVGQMLSFPSLIDIMPKSFKKKAGERLDVYAKEIQASAFKDLDVVENYIRENPLAVDVEQQPFLNKIRDPEWVARGLTLNLPSFVSSLGLTTVVTLVTKNPVAGLATGFGSAFSLEGGDAYNEALRSGVDEVSARTIAIGVGAVNGILEMVFPGRKLAELMGGSQVKKSFFRHLATNLIADMATEASTETVQEIVSNVARMTYDEHATLLQGTPEAAFFGALMGGIGSVGTTAVGMQGGLQNIQPGLSVKEMSEEERRVAVKEAVSEKEVTPEVTLKFTGTDKAVMDGGKTWNYDIRVGDTVVGNIEYSKPKLGELKIEDINIKEQHKRQGIAKSAVLQLLDKTKSTLMPSGQVTEEGRILEESIIKAEKKPEGLAIEEAVTEAITPERLNQALEQRGQKPIEFSKVLKPGETIEEWIRDFRKANSRGQLLELTRKAMESGDAELLAGSSAQAVENMNILSVYDSLKSGETPKIISVEEFQRSLVKKPRTTVKKLEKEIQTERFDSLLEGAKTQKEFVSRVEALRKQLEKPEVRENKAQLKKVKALVNKHIERVTGVRPERKEYRGKRAKDRLALWEMAKSDPATKEAMGELEELFYELDELTTGGRQKAEDIAAAKDMGLPAEGNLYIPYGKASFKGTQNRQWVQQTVPLAYMGNKSQMLDYIVRGVFNVGKKDLGDITPADVAHLKHYKRVYDLFGGSGLLTNLGKLLFRGRAKFFYNEFDSGVINALEVAQQRPDDIQKHVLQVGKYIKDNPGADWLSHFKLVFKEDKDFQVAAKLIESHMTRGSELTAYKINNLVKAIPNFSKIFKNVEMTNKDAFKIMDKLVKTGGEGDIVFIDPPYLWSQGYAKGSEMERTEGFMKVMDYIDKLNKRGVTVVAFNNDPEIQAPKAGLESVHLDNIMGRLNQLSRDMVVVHGVKPIGTAREEIIITNTPESKESHNLVRQVEVERRVEEVRKLDGGELSAEMLEFFRDVSGKTRFVSKADRITDGQINRIRARRSRMHIKNREMIPVFDELLRETSFAKMTKKDGERLLEWMSPRNWEIIEKKIELVRQMSLKERAEAIVGDRVVAKDEVMEDRFGIIGKHNDVVRGVERIAKLVPNVPNPEPTHSNLIKDILKFISPTLSPGQATKLLGIYHRWFVPLRMIVNVSKEEQNISKSLHRMIDKMKVTPDEQEQIVFIQSNAEKQYKQKHPGKKITKKVRKIADYWQELSQAKYDLINRLRLARDMKPLPKIKPRYIPWIIQENIMEALGMPDRANFTKARLKLARDLQAGLFTYDLHRIVDLWSSSSASYLKKNLYGALMQDRYEALYGIDPDNSAQVYAKEIIDRDIYNLPPVGIFEKQLRSLGSAINRRAGWIIPKRVPIDPALAESLLDTGFAKELQDSIEKGYLEVPRFKFPNVISIFHAFFYPAKLALNVGFFQLNRLQPFYATPFVGLPNKIMGRAKMFFVINPFNKKKLNFYKNALEKTGYEFGRVRNDYTPMNFTRKWQRKLDLAINLLVDASEFMNRLENTIDFELYLNKIAKDQNITIPKEEVVKVAARMSAHINGLYGKGYSPVMQRSSIGRLVYTFQQFTVNMIELSQDMINSAMNDKKARDLWTAWTRESLADEKVEQLFNDMPLKSRANFLTILMAFTVPVALMYSYWQRWNIAARAIPWLNPAVASDFLIALAEWTEDPNKGTVDKLKKVVRNTFSVNIKSRAKDALDVYEYGMIETRYSHSPVFIEPTLRNIWGLIAVGRGISDQYEEAFPTELAKWIGGKTRAGEVKRLEEETEEEREQVRKDAIELFRVLRKDEAGDEALALIEKFKEEGRLTDSLKEKVRGFLEKEVRGTTFLDRDITQLRDDKQAEFVLDRLDKTDSAEEVEALMLEYRKKGILTDNVKEKMRELMQLRIIENQAGGFANP